MRRNSKEFVQPVSAPVATVRRAMRFLALCLLSLVLPALAAPTGLSPSGGATGTQYTGFLTKKGCEYAWGKGGEAKTEWVEADGTPMELKRPEGDGWELMVR